ncbi:MULTISPECIES: hypothetical protein [unclassified Streptomyces]|uniref:hypothetical protein n=1 Tax=unclassified Streptomyces TaxID=2593676 RepID=UPI00166190DB|nr:MULTISPECIES: hypothetical protein [unclassified Streptomyces]MBD0837188.1 hypothetical protein [Streptomyces sp. TRM68416]
MGTIVLSGAAVLVVLGFGNSVYWLAAVALLFLYLQYGRGARPSSGSAGGSSSGSFMPSSYQAYRKRRETQAKWERRYRREHPFETRRQERQKKK